MVKSSTVTVNAYKIDTTLTIEVYPGSGPPYPQSVAGYLKRADTGEPISGREVQLYIGKSPAAPSYYGSCTTLGDGSWGFYNVKVEEGTYIFRAVFPGDDVYNGTSVEASASFAKPDTNLTINVSPSSGIIPLTVTISGKLTRKDTGAGLGGRTINLYRNGSLIATTTTSIDPSTLGEYRFTDTLSAAGSYSYFTEFPGDDYFKGCGEENKPRRRRLI